jgi:serine phosphatase RsbU (regulator of sigma subunit)/pSer/pThr/pTyr-binding forkhead associated (FHA) protein
LLGRHAECDINDIFAEQSGVSRFHALIECTGGKYSIEDKGSLNGTLLNGKRLSGRAPLRSGDRLAIGGVELTFQEEGPAPGTTDPSSSHVLNGISFTEPAGAPTPLSSRAVAAPGLAAPLTGYSAEKLRALVTMLKRLGRSLEINATLNELLHGLFGIFPQARRGFVAFTTEESEDVTPRAALYRTEEPNARMGISRTLVRHVLSRREAVLWSGQDPSSGLGTPGTLVDLAICSLLCAPLLDGDGSPFGVVQIDTDKPAAQFTAEDLEVMVGAVSQAAVAVRFAKLHEEALRRQTVAHDLELARRVQLGLLPEDYPDCEGFEFFAFYRAANEVGGDYYDFIELPQGRLALVVADAAGKGVSAALMMAKLSGELKYHLSCESPGAALARMNDSLCAGGTGRFVTLLVAVLDRGSPTMTLVNAGHPAPLLRRADKSVVVVGEKARGAALGLMPEAHYQEVKTQVEPGDIWLGYTDGFTEAVNVRGEMFGAARLRDGLSRAPGIVRESGDRIVREVMNFLGDEAQSDDMCLLAWSRLPAGAEAAASTAEFEPARWETTKAIPPKPIAKP